MALRWNANTWRPQKNWNPAIMPNWSLNTISILLLRRRIKCSETNYWGNTLEDNLLNVTSSSYQVFFHHRYLIKGFWPNFLVPTRFCVLNFLRPEFKRHYDIQHYFHVWRNNLTLKMQKYKVRFIFLFSNPFYFIIRICKSL